MTRTDDGIPPSVDGSPVPIDARAALSSYLVLAAPFFVLTVLSVIATLKYPGNDAYQLGLATLGMGLLLGTWLRGFRVRITGKDLYLRNGLYRNVSVPLDDIRKADTGWVEQKFGFRRVQMLRLIVVYGDGPHRKRVTLNIKPFTLDDLGRIRETLQGAIARNQQRSP